jgi:all-trans-retinol dehydrogenase (NAD+)
VSSPGFTADLVATVIKNTVLHPGTALLGLLLAQYEPSGRYLAQKRKVTLQTLRVLFVLGFIRVFNAWLSRRAINNRVWDRYDWPREVIVVTGGSDGIGKRIVLLLAARVKTKIAILDIQEPRYDLPEGTRFYHCDITQSEAIATAASQIRSELGADPTVLINNAGVMLAHPMLEGTEEETRLTFEVNTLSHYRLAREFLPAMISRNHGMVVTVASMAGLATSPRFTDYSASKAAAISFHEGLAAELVTSYAAPRVRTVLVTQSFVRTHLIRDIKPQDTFSNPLLAPETVAEAIVDQVLTGESGHVSVPRFLGPLLWQLRALLWWYQSRLRQQLAELS